MLKQREIHACTSTRKEQLAIKKQRLKSLAPLARLWPLERIRERTTDCLTLEKSFQCRAQLCVRRGCFFLVLL